MTYDVFMKTFSGHIEGLEDNERSEHKSYKRKVARLHPFTSVTNTPFTELASHSAPKQEDADEEPVRANLNVDDELNDAEL